MLHVHRQITGLREFEPHILTQKRQHAERFPFPDEGVTVIARLPGVMRELRRFWYRNVAKKPRLVSGAERRAILGAIQDAGAGLLHVYFGHTAVHLLPVLRESPAPVVVSFHGADAGVDMGKAVYREMMGEVFRVSKLVMVRSASLGRELEKLGCPESKIRVQRTGIPLEEWPFVQREWPGNSEGEWRFVQAGRLIEKKGLDTTLRVFAKIREIYPKARLTFLGEGPLLTQTAELARELGVAEAVEFTGFVDANAMRAAFAEAHGFFHPSRTGKDGNQEGVPNAMLEAMATGLPVFATKHGGIPEAVESGMSGVLVEENDAEVLGRGVLEVIGNRELYEAMSKAARAAVEAGFGQRAQIERLEAIYREALELV